MPRGGVRSMPSREASKERDWWPARAPRSCAPGARAARRGGRAAQEPAEAREHRLLRRVGEVVPADRPLEDQVAGEHAGPPFGSTRFPACGRECGSPPGRTRPRRSRRRRTSDRTFSGRPMGDANPAPHPCGSVSACSSSLWMYRGSSVPHISTTAPTWSTCPCVASTATGRFPAAASSAFTRSAENPGSTTTRVVAALGGQQPAVRGVRVVGEDLDEHGRAIVSAAHGGSGRAAALSPPARS